MKTTIKSLLITIFVVSSCQQNPQQIVSFANPLDSQRENEVIEIDIDDFENIFGEFDVSKQPLFIIDSDTLVTQVVKSQENNRPQTVLVEVSLPANGSKEARLEWVGTENYPEFPEKTNIHFARLNNPNEDLETAERVQTVKTEETSQVFQMEGPSWENDKVGFRNYFDLRNGMDIFGKKTSEMVLDHVGLGEEADTPDNFDFKSSYHESSDWGMDILKVGNSLGAGAVALEVNDSLYRIGDNGNGSYEKLYEGPLKSEFIFNFPAWEIMGESFDIIQHINIVAGEYCYVSDLYLNEGNADASFVTGIVNMESDSLIEFEAGNEHVAFITHAPQAYNGNFLSMAVMVKKDDYLSKGETRDTGEGITQTYFIRLNTGSENPSEYRFFAFWESTNPDFKELDTIKSILNEEALRIENPVNIESK